jgi:hypothetical protein
MQAAPMNMNGMVMQQTMGGGMNMGGMGNGFASMPMAWEFPMCNLYNFQDSKLV